MSGTNEGVTSPEEVSKEQSVSDKPVRRRSKPNNVKLFEGLLEHASKIALVQYGLTGSFAYLMFVDAAHRPTSFDILGLKFDLTLWISAAPLVYGLINFHMRRVIRQMTRLLRKDQENAASMAISAVQSAWFGNPFHNAAGKSILALTGWFYGTMYFLIPIFFMMGVANEIYIQVGHSRVDRIVTAICVSIFGTSIFMLPDTLDQCRSQIRKVLLQPPLGPLSEKAGAAKISSTKDGVQQPNFMKLLFQLLSPRSS